MQLHAPTLIEAPRASSTSTTANLLWTGGWDSTFRLLDLVVRQGRSVTPHYIVDWRRAGTLHELGAMSAIRKRIEGDFPGRGKLIQPTRITLIDSIAEDLAITEKLKRLRLRSSLGSQYDWLARHVDQQQINSLELCIHADDKAEGFVRDHVEHITDAEGNDYWQIRADAAGGDIGLFANFHFPILSMTKTQMRRIAQASGLSGIMSLTWFCHTPIDGRPCGICSPCQYTIDEGLADRLPGRALLRNRFAPYLNKTSKIRCVFYKTLGQAVKPLIQRERKRRSAVTP